MSTALQIERMSLAEKLETMEILWNDLAHQVKDGAIPEWHSEVLTAREADVSVGLERFEDWEAAKESIRAALK